MALMSTLYRSWGCARLPTCAVRGGGGAAAAAAAAAGMSALEGGREATWRRPLLLLLLHLVQRHVLTPHPH